MSDSSESLRRKIGGAADLQSVVRTMKALAASSISQYENAVVSLQNYYRTVELGLVACLRQTEMLNMMKQPAKSNTSAIGVIVFGSDQGLVGQFNDVLAKYHNVVFVAHGHMHDYSVSKPYPNGIPYVNVYSVEHKKYNVIELKNDTFEVATYSF
jgi:F0F1-type ATP synthase gamma subunit